MRLITAFAFISFTGLAPAAVVVDGALGGGEGYVTAINASPGVDTNVDNHSGGVHAKVERILTADDPGTLHVFIEGDLRNTNGLFVLVDSDNSAGTGFSGAHPDGTTVHSGALEYFTALPAGGYDLTLVIRGGSSGTPSNFEEIHALTYSAAGTLLEEIEISNGTGSLTATLPATVRGIAASLEIGEITGDAPDNGIELGIPKAWLLYQGQAGGSLQVVAMNSNGTFDTWYNSTIPENALPSGTSIGPISNPANNGVMAGLTAPDFAWQSVPVEIAVFAAD